MVVPETTGRDQKVVYWPAADSYTDSGRRKVSSSYSELDVRWEEKKRQTTNANGEVISLDAMAVVNQDITPGSIFWVGETDDLPDPVTDVTDLYEVVFFNKVPSLKSNVYRRTVDLRKYGDVLPPTV